MTDMQTPDHEFDDISAAGEALQHLDMESWSSFFATRLVLILALGSLSNYNFDIFKGLIFWIDVVLAIDEILGVLRLDDAQLSLPRERRVVASPFIHLGLMALLFTLSIQVKDESSGPLWYFFVWLIVPAILDLLWCVLGLVAFGGLLDHSGPSEPLLSGLNDPQPDEPCGQGYLTRTWMSQQELVTAVAHDDGVPMVMTNSFLIKRPFMRVDN